MWILLFKTFSRKYGHKFFFPILFNTFTAKLYFMVIPLVMLNINQNERKNRIGILCKSCCLNIFEGSEREIVLNMIFFYKRWIKLFSAVKWLSVGQNKPTIKPRRIKNHHEYTSEHDTFTTKNISCYFYIIMSLLIVCSL